MKMDERKQKVLQAIILDYIATAEPVGSRTISRKYNLGVSPATVRNEMADLEELGLIEQPHTSAGRIPSQSGYRYYVDCLMEKEPLDKDIKDMISKAMMVRMRETEALIQISGKLLSQLTSYTALILAPSLGRNALRHLQILPIDDNKAVVVIVLDNGHVEHKVIDVPSGINNEDFTAISRVLNEQLYGLPVEQWRPTILQTIYHELLYQKKLLNSVIELVENAITIEGENKVYLGGTLNILNQPEFKDIEKVKSLLELLEQESAIKEVLHPAPEAGITVKIGSENIHQSMKNCSLITATYQVNGRVIGTLGVLGPTRMEYSKAVSILEYITEALSKAITRL